jgi:hypothetical protein
VSLTKDQDRFLVKADRTNPGGCWNWTACKSPDSGYGEFRLRGKSWYAHRAAYDLFRGPLVDGMFVCHSCDNRACVNPAHLFLGTHADNMADMVAKGRSKRSSVLTEDQVRAIRSSSRTTRDLAREFGVSQTLAWAIKRGKRLGGEGRRPSQP